MAPSDDSEANIDEVEEELSFQQLRQNMNSK